jgi:DNA primase
MSYDPKSLEYVFNLKSAKIVGNNIMSRCPMDGHRDIHRSFGINLSTGEWNCFACRECGSNIRTLAYVLKVQLTDDLMLQSLRLAPVVNNPDSPITYSGLDGLSEGVELAHNELEEKGISIKALERFRVGYQKGSVIFPCVLPDERLYGWVERNSLWAGRYGFRPDNVKRKFLLFGMDRKIKRAYLVESMTDMLKLVSWHEEAISTCGNIIFEEQAKLLLEWCEEIVLVPQRDIAAKKWIEDYKKYLKGKIRTYGIIIKSGFKDVCSLGYSEELWLEDKKFMKFLF